MHISELDTPAVLIDLDRMERNIRRAQEHCGRHGKAMRPHIKTHKIPQIARMQVEAGAVGITCAKLGEVEVMVGAGLREILLAYPIVGEAKLRRLVRVAQEANLTVAFDSLEVAQGISEAVGRYGEGSGREIGALVEIDTGMGRCGIAPGPEMVALCRRVADLPGLRFRGLMTYQGWVTGTAEERAAKLQTEDERLKRILGDLAEAGLETPVVSGGSTPTLFQSHLVEPITENRAGTYVFNDVNTVSTGAVTLDDCAMRIAVTVVSTAVPGQIIIDGGSKTFTSDRSAGPGEVTHGYVVEDPELRFVKMNEEHGYVKRDRSTKSYRIGDRLHVIPNHVCVAMNMHEEVYGHRNGEVVETWPVAARGKLR
jgi:D-serine deaminase-like pyridoxal phosphate-dependent protein